MIQPARDAGRERVQVDVRARARQGRGRDQTALSGREIGAGAGGDAVHDGLDERAFGAEVVRRRARGEFQRGVEGPMGEGPESLRGNEIYGAVHDETAPIGCGSGHLRSSAASRSSTTIEEALQK